MAVTLSQLREALNALGKTGVLERTVHDEAWQQDWDRIGALAGILYDPAQSDYRRDRLNLLHGDAPEEEDISDRVLLTIRRALEVEQELEAEEDDGDEDSEEESEADTLMPPMESLFLRKANVLRAMLGLEPKVEELLLLKGDSIQYNFWKKCWKKIPKFGRDQKWELIHDAFVRTVTENLLQYRRDEGLLTFYFESHMLYRLIDLVRERFGRVPKKAGEQEKQLTEQEKQRKEKQEYLKRVRTTMPASIYNPLSKNGSDHDDDTALTLSDTLEAEETGFQKIEYQEMAVQSVELMVTDLERRVRELELLATELELRKNRNRSGKTAEEKANKRKTTKLTNRQVMFTSIVINLEHCGEEEPPFRYRPRIEDALLGPFADFSLENQPGASLLRIRSSPIREQYFRPLPGNGKNREERLVGILMDTAGAKYLNVKPSTYSEHINKYRFGLKLSLIQTDLP